MSFVAFFDFIRILADRAPLAQLDRVAAFEAVGCRFEPCREHHSHHSYVRYLSLLWVYLIFLGVTVVTRKQS